MLSAVAVFCEVAGRSFCDQVAGPIPGIRGGSPRQRASADYIPFWDYLAS